ncbi:MAG: DEAD/DEAH box helicase [Flavobacteriales bacterium]|jgi:ATP-dependent RNA helicase DeaD|nr:DEAD/DEAH box helicase [Flavobacteriales bacterium]
MPTFKELGLRTELIQALDELGFEKPTEIQEKAIPQMLDSKKDLIALAQTGTGKTAAFSLPVLEQLQTEENNIQCIVLCPTRELCLQITKDMQSFAKFLDLKTVAVYGGASIETQIRALKKGAHVVVGTPGRTVDLINRRVLKLRHVNYVVLDEADEMLTMGFKDDLDTILAETPESKQTLLFSATMPKGIRDIVRRYMHEPAEVTAGTKNAGATNVEHQYYLVNARDKYECLKRLADVNPKVYGIVFCRTRRETKEIADKLMQDGYNADALHGDLSQQQRDTVMGRFRQRHLQILVATDVAARGLDVDDLTHVINYNLPDEEEVYIHRSGRTGRAGKKGISIAVIHGRERGKLKAVERKLKKQFVQQPVPTGKEICEKQLYAIVDRLGKIEINEKQIEPFLPAILQQLGHLSKEDLVKHLVSFEFNRFLDYYRNARDLNTSTDSRERSRDRGERRERRDRGKRDKRSDRTRNGVDFTRFHINVGNKEGVNPAKLMGLINEQLSKRDVEIGKIEVMNTFSFFELDSTYADKLMDKAQGSDHNGKKLNLSIAKSTGPNYRASSGPRTKDKLKSKFKRNKPGFGDKNKGARKKRPRRPF